MNRHILASTPARLALLFCLTIFFAVPADQGLAATFTLDSTLDNLTNDGSLTLREAIANSNNNAMTSADGPAGDATAADVILIPTGTYTVALLGFGEDLNLLGDYDLLDTAGIVFIGAGSDVTIIDAALSDRAFHAHLGSATFEDLTIRNGSAMVPVKDVQEGVEKTSVVDDGGGILFESDFEKLVLDSVTIENCEAENWGGAVDVDCVNPCVLIENSVIFDNQAGTFGGGVSVFAIASSEVTSVTITDSSFEENSAGSQGGGLICLIPSGSPELVIQGSVFNLNQCLSSHGGGAILSAAITKSEKGMVNLGPASVVISDSTFQTNFTDMGNGGGFATFWLSNLDVLIERSTFLSNDAEFDGGGVYLNADDFSQAHVLDSLFDNNFCKDEGGGLYADFPHGSTCTVVNTEFLGNTASLGGGASLGLGHSFLKQAMTLVSSLEILDSTFTDNYAYDIFPSKETEEKLLFSGGEGGGLRVTDDVLATTIENTVFDSNWAEYSGGGFHWRSFGSSFAASGLLVVDNTAESGLGGGGYISNYDGPTTLLNSRFLENACGSRGGGLSVQFCGDFLAEGNTFTGNQSSNEGGGLYFGDICSSAKVSSESEKQIPFATSESIIRASTFTFNQAGLGMMKSTEEKDPEKGFFGYYGGGLFGDLFDADSLLETSYFFGNIAQDGGGAAAYESIESELEIAGCLIEDNTGFHADPGGGLSLRLYNNDSCLIRDSTFSNNFAFQGVGGGIGIYACVSPVTIENILNFDNWAAYNGGGLYHEAASACLGKQVASASGDVAIADATFSGNYSGENGGGIHLRGNNFNSTIVGCSVFENGAQFQGGGISEWIGVSVYGDFLHTIATSRIFDNTCEGTGGGIDLAGISSASPTSLIDQCEIAGNFSGEDGAGLNIGGTEMEVFVNNSTVSGNFTTENGGGIALGDLPLKGGPPPSGPPIIGCYLNNCTISYNVADWDEDGSGEGGGLFAENLSFKGSFSEPAAFWLANTIVAENEDLSEIIDLKTRGGEKAITVLEAPDIYSPFTGAFISFCYNLIGNSEVRDLQSLTVQDQWFFPNIGDQTGDFDFPIDPVLNPLAFNGASTRTHALGGGSPALDMGNGVMPSTNGYPGDASGCVDCRTVDQRDVMRGVDGDADGFARCDIGAFEASAPGIEVTKTVSQGSILSSEAVEFTVVVNNPGESSAGMVSATDTLPLGLTFDASSVMTSTGSVDFDDPDLVWSIGTLAAGQSATLTFSATVGSVPTIVNEVLVRTVAGDSALSATDDAPLQVIQRPVKIAFTPPMNDPSVARDSVVAATYDQEMAALSVTPENFAVHAMETGQVTSTLTLNGNVISLQPDIPFKPGELVQVTATRNLLSASEGVGPATSCVWQFRATAAEACGTLLDSGQILGASDSNGVALGDLDGDGDVDAFVANDDLIAPGKSVPPTGAEQIWINNGNGFFSAGQILGGADRSAAVALGDVDGDGDLDALVANESSESVVYLNNGNATFAFGQYLTGPDLAVDIEVADLDGDGDLDAIEVLFVTGKRVWINNGSGTFSLGQTLSTSQNRAVGIGDVDNDGDLDVFVARGSGSGNEVWLNDGDATFMDSGQVLGASESYSVDMGDIDGDGDLDAVVGNILQPHSVFLNDGSGVFTEIFALDEPATDVGYAISLADLDGDGLLDVLVAGNLTSSVWINQGGGLFLHHQSFASGDSRGADTADLDGDGDIDGFFANGANQGNTVYFNTCVADVEIAKTGPSEAVVAGGTIEYLIEVTNNGPASATEVTIVDSLPSELTFLSASPGLCGASGNVLTCNLGTLLAGEAVSVTVEAAVSPSASGSLSNTAMATTGSHDPMTDNNSSMATTPVRTEADLSILKSDMPDMIAANSTVLYTLEVTNAGPSDATGVTIVDILPASTTYVSSSDDCMVNGSTVTCGFGALAAGQMTSVTIEVLIDPAFAGVLFNTGRVVPGTPDPNPSNNEDMEMTGVFLEADLAIAKVASASPVLAGSTFTYALTVTNLGPTESVDVRITDVLPMGLTPLSWSAGCMLDGATLTCDLGMLMVSEVVTATVEVRVDSGYTGDIVNSATVTAETMDPVPANDVATATTATGTSADLIVTKTASLDLGIGGEPLTYTIEVTNLGPSDAIEVELDDPLPPALALLLTSLGCNVTDQLVHCSLGDIAAGLTETVTMEVEIAPGFTGLLTNTVTVTGGNGGSATSTIPVVAQADLSLTLSDDPDPVMAGNSFNLSGIVTNNGPSDATGVQVLFNLPPGTATETKGLPPGGVVMQNVGDLGAGQSTPVNILVNVDSMVPEGQVVVSATATSETPDPNLVNNSDMETTGVTGVPEPTATATSTPANTPTPTRTLLPSEDCDSGYYVLDSLGGRHRVGNPITILGPLYFGNDIARDLERAVCLIGSPTQDLVVLDGLGASHFVANEICNIPQTFYFPDQSSPFERGRAVDLVMTADSLGLWVLTDFGGIYRAGTAMVGGEDAAVPGTDTASNLGFDMPMTGMMRDPNLPSPGGATLRAVSLVVIDEDLDSQAEGYIILDSMGGRLHLGPDGTPIPTGFAAGSPENSPRRLLQPDFYVWPFFVGLDIARDMEPVSSLQGVVILDGWDGIHPVPVNVESNPVFFARNIVSASDSTPAQAVGLPYITAGFDNPNTMSVDESDEDLIGIDVASIFADLEFSVGCADGLYTLDRFGGVFGLGAVRVSESEPVPGFGNSPYFFPLLYAEDMEVFGRDEVDGEETLFARF